MPEVIFEGDEYDAVRVRAVMNFPRDGHSRDRYFAIHSARLAGSEAKGRDAIKVSVKTLRLLLEGFDPNLQRDSEIKAIKKGAVAGDMLATIYLMHSFSDRHSILTEPSMNKAVYVAQEFACEETYGDGSRMYFSEPKIRDCWRSFQPVAHLWAAARLNKDYPFAPDREIFSSGFKAFLGVAAELLRFGRSFVPFRAWRQDPVLDALEAWTLPGSVHPAPLQSDRLPDRLIKTLESYKALPP
jgi:hypothetical protein